MRKCFPTFAAVILILGTLTPNPTYSYEPDPYRKFDAARAKECKEARDLLLSQIKEVDTLYFAYPKDAATLKEGNAVMKWKADLKNLCLQEEEQNMKYMQFETLHGEFVSLYQTSISSLPHAEVKASREKLERIKRETKEMKEKMDETSAKAMKLEARQRAIYTGVEKTKDSDLPETSSERRNTYTEVTPEMRSLPERLTSLVTSIKNIQADEKALIEKLAAYAQEKIRAYEIGKSLTEVDRKVRELQIERDLLARKLNQKSKPRSSLKVIGGKVKGKSEEQQMAEKDAKTSLLSNELSALDQKLDPLVMESRKLNQAIEKALWPNRSNAGGSRRSSKR